MLTMVNRGACLTSLPLELLELIFTELVHPLDFCNASSTCKQLRTASERLMNDHQALAFQYTTLNFDGSEDGSGNVWTVLSEILKDLRICYHVREVNFEADRQLFYDPEVRGSWDLSSSTIRPPRDLLDSLATAEGADSILRFSMQSFEDGFDDEINSLLIRQLPNLHEIKYVDNGEGVNFGRFIRETAASRKDSTDPLFLSKLKFVNLEHWDTEGGMDLSWVLDFLCIPSVQTIRGHMIDADEGWAVPALDSNLTRPKSNVTSLVFTYSCIELGALDKLLSYTSNLKSFSYEHAGGIVGYAEYEPRGMVAVLLKHAGHSLEVLKIENGDDQDVDETSPYCSMSEFKALKIVDVEWFTLIANEEEVIDDAEKDEPLSQGFFKQSEADQFDPDVAAALPPTIQHLKLTRFPEAEMSSIIKLLTEKEEGRVASDLLNITLCREFCEEPGPGWEELNEAANRVGVTVDDKTESTEAGIRLLQSGWTPRRGTD